MHIEIQPEDMNCIDSCSICVDYGDPCNSSKECGGIREMTDKEREFYKTNGYIPYGGV